MNSFNLSYLCKRSVSKYSHIGDQRFNINSGESQFSPLHISMYLFVSHLSQFLEIELEICSYIAILKVYFSKIIKTMYVHCRNIGKCRKYLRKKNVIIIPPVRLEPFKYFNAHLMLTVCSETVYYIDEFTLYV